MTKVRKVYIRKQPKIKAPKIRIKKLNTSLNTAVIASDFFLLNQDLTQKIGTLKKNYTTLDPFVLCKEIKQFIRLVFFIRKRRRSFINLYCKDKKKVKILTTFINQRSKKLHKPVRVLKTPKIVLNPRRIPVHLSIFFNPLADEFLVKNVRRYRTFLTSIVDYNLTNSQSTYMIRNKIDSLKKLIFLMALLESVLLKK